MFCLLQAGASCPPHSLQALLSNAQFALAFAFLTLSDALSCGLPNMKEDKAETTYAASPTL